MRTLALLPVLFLCACAAPRINPSFPVTIPEARHDLRRMRDHPRPPLRPIVVVGGYADPGIAPSQIAARLHEVLGTDAPIIPVEVSFCSTMDAARQRLIERVEFAFPSSSVETTIPVDVVAVSMGGLVARYAAAPPPSSAHSRRLSVVRLFTIASPHRGANMAAVPTLESRVEDMRPGSAFLTALDAHASNFELVAYARLGDSIVGEENTSPPDVSPWWVDTPPLEAAHLQAHTDPRLLADIARTLRGEDPFRRPPAWPLP